MTPKAVLGSVVDGFKQLTVSYQEARILMEEKKDDYHEILEPGSFLKKNALFKEVFAEMKDTMCRNVGNTGYVLKVFGRFCMAVDSYHISGEDVRLCCYEMASAVAFIHFRENSDRADPKLRDLMLLLLHAGREEACEMTRIFLTKLLDEKNGAEAHEVVSKAKQYIKEHLTEEISVSSIAAALFLSPNYFSRLFKQATGVGCNEYIVRERIEKAKLLLENTNCRTNRIASMAGYKDTNYFYLAFKKQTGMTPTKYREQFRK